MRIYNSHPEDHICDATVSKPEKTIEHADCHVGQLHFTRFWRNESGSIGNGWFGSIPESKLDAILWYIQFGFHELGNKNGRFYQDDVWKNKGQDPAILFGRSGEKSPHSPADFG